MDIEWLQQNWALPVAGGLLVVVFAVYLRAAMRNSAGGKLAQALRHYRARDRQLARAKLLADRAQRKLNRLEHKSASTKPRLVTESGEALADATALVRIAQDQVMVAAQQLRKVIVEEFPPSRHDALRKKYLPDDGPDGRPFSF